MYAERKTITLTTDASGNVTGYIPVEYGRILSINYVKNNYATGVDFAIKTEFTNESLWVESDVNASKIVYPHAPINDQSGESVQTVGNNEIYECIVTANDRVKFVISNGGDAKSGTFTIIYG